MAEGFYVTNKGLEEITKAVETDTKVEIKKVGFGSGASIGDEWDYGIESLKESIYEKDLDPLTDSYEVNESDPKSLAIKVVVPVGQALTINEIGFFDTQNNLILYGIVREREKTDVDEFEYRCWVKFDNTDESAVQVVVKSPEFERVEELVNQARSDFDKSIEETKGIVDRAEEDFDLSNYVTQDQIKQLEENSNKVWHLDPDNPTCTLSDLESKSETAKFGDMYIISDDNNHAYVFLGSSVAGTVNNGFYDIGGHVDLTNYTTEGEYNTLAERVQKVEEKIGVIEPMLTGLDSALEELIGTVE